MEEWYYSPEVSANLLRYSQNALAQTLASANEANIVEELASLVADLEIYVRGYERIEELGIDTDDEILNWTFSEVPSDFCASIWLLASGYYKASASSLRTAFEIAAVALYFQIRENTDPGEAGYNRFFRRWDIGAGQAPNWGEMKPFIAKQPAVSDFATATGIDIVSVAYDHYRELCAYTHTSAFTSDGEPVTSINTTGVTPLHKPEYFHRGAELVRVTIALIAMLWSVAFPQIIKTRPLGSLVDKRYLELFGVRWHEVVVRPHAR